MNRFYIKKLTVSGPNHKDSIIEFGPALNFILGPSNTGKSLVMACIDYVFGFTPRKDKPSAIVENNNGYDCVSLILATSKGEVSLRRTIGESRIYVSGDNYRSGYYSTSREAKQSINSFYLDLLGIDDNHKIRKAQTGDKTQALTWRSMLHLFFLKQEDVARTSSALLFPRSNNDTAALAVLLFLLTGQDASNVSTKEDPKVSEGKREALIAYLSNKVNHIASRRAEIENALSSAKESSSYLSIDEIRQQIAILQEKIDTATHKSQKLMSHIYSLNGTLSETRTVKDNFKNLRIQYKADIKRIGFVIDCANATKDQPQTVTCPICGNKTANITDSSIIEASAAELQKIKQNLNELNTAEKSLNVKENDLVSTINALEKERIAIDTLISRELQPELSRFQVKLEESLKYIRLTGELDNVRANELDLRNELFEKETQEIPKQTEYHIKEDYTSKLIHGYEELLRGILKESKFGGAETARLNMDNFDIEINGLKKSVCSGGGNCGILNTIVTLAMNKYLIGLGRYAPGFYAVDSSLTQLSESEYKEQDDTVKQNFIQYLIEHTHEHQVIFVEQKKRMPFIPENNEDAGVRTITFTHDRNHGRYGFLNDVYNPEDQL